MSEFRRARPVAGLVVVGLVLVACGSPPASTPAPGGASPSITSPPSASSAPSASATSSAIAHPTDATTVILRMEDVGGFVPITFLAMRLPAWTLYGDGTLLLAPDGVGMMNPAIGPTPPMRFVKLDEAQIQSVLETALVRGGLAAARESYESVGIMDAPTTVFTVRAGGLDKEVRILALGFEEPQPGPDTLARQNFQELRVYLENLADDARDDAVDYQPTGFVGVLIELEAQQPGSGPDRAWPWNDLAPADFVSDPAAEFVALPERVLTVAQLEAAGINVAKGGHYGITLKAADGKRYDLVVRPQLPDGPAAAG
jgi:hypothetical protein